MENLQAVVQGLPVEKDLTDDGWTRHFGPVTLFPRDPSWTTEEYARRAEEFDFEVMESHRRRIDDIVEDPATAEILKPYYRYACKRPLFHDEYLPSLNAPNVEVVDCPAGIERITERGLVVEGREYEVDCIVYATGFEGESTPLPRRAGCEIVGRHGIDLAEKWADGPRTLFGMMSRGFPNLFMMPTAYQQSVIGPNYTLIAVQGADFVGAVVAGLEEQGVAAFEVSETAEDDWCEEILATRVDSTHFASLCTPSRFNNEGDPTSIPPLASNWGGGFGDYFGFKERLAEFRARGEFPGLELEK